jgi:hypothetical protein
MLFDTNRFSRTIVAIIASVLGGPTPPREQPERCNPHGREPGSRHGGSGTRHTRGLRGMTPRKARSDGAD